MRQTTREDLQMDETIKLPIEWATEYGYLIVDPDGWRGANGRPFDEPISLEEFGRRSPSSTVAPLSTLSGQVHFEAALKRSGLGPEKIAALRDLAATHADSEVLAALAERGARDAVRGDRPTCSG